MHIAVPTLGRLERVDLRLVWASESNHFTPWLATKENIALLGEAIGLDLEVEAEEKNVGPFQADILCKDVTQGSWVLVENQLERTDHTHLGQLLTYAAGLEAVTIVWVAQRFTEEHRATLDWLNEITDERFNFFGLEIELWKIGDSPAAPKFNVVSRPNDWSRSVGEAARTIEVQNLGPRWQNQIAYWTRFNEVLSARNGVFRTRKPSTSDFLTWGTGTPGTVFIAIATGRRVLAGVVLHAPAAKPLFRALEKRRAEIEAAFGEALDWRELPEKKESQIVLQLPGATVTDEAEWARQHAWLLEKLEKFHAVFGPRLPGAMQEAEREG